MKSFELLKKYRLKKKITQKEVAAFLHVQPQTYSQYESGKRKMDVDLFIQLIDFLHIPAFEFSEKAYYLHYKDFLTGVYHRKAYFEKMEDVPSTFVHVLFDIYQFKDFNDAYGHDKGDEMLKTIADAITSLLPSHSFVGRVGGEEFLVCFLEQEWELLSISIVQNVKEICGLHLNYSRIEF